MSAGPSPVIATALVALGGAVGAAMRFHVSYLAQRWIGASSQFPWGTLTVNVLGSLAMGVMIGWIARTGEGSESMRLLLGVGVLGGFTTFSAFSAEMIALVHRGQIMLAVGYGAASVMAGMAALLVGLIAIQSADMGSA